MGIIHQRHKFVFMNISLNFKKKNINLVLKGFIIQKIYPNV